MPDGSLNALRMGSKPASAFARGAGVSGIGEMMASEMVRLAYGERFSRNGDIRLSRGLLLIVGVARSGSYRLKRVQVGGGALGVSGCGENGAFIVAQHL
jgi:hypothetical protein